MKKNMMKSLMILLTGFAILTLFSCSKTEIDLTGDLVVNVANSTSVSNSNISVNVHLNDANGAVIASGHVNSDGKFKANLLYGNYYVWIMLQDPYTYEYSIQDDYVQIKGGGKTTNVSFRFINK